MFKSNSHKHEKLIQQALHNIITDKYSSIKTTVHIYDLLNFILTHHIKDHQSQALEHEAFQLLNSNQKKTLKN